MKCDIIAGFKESVSAYRWWCGWKGRTWRRARKILADSGLKITTADDLTDAAKKVVAAAKG
jgi:succinyl-CoA synthetase beta subunit